MMISTTSTARNDNPGIVPPWLSGPTPAKNPGIVPPWLQTPVHILPIDEEPIVTILPVGGNTAFVSEPTFVSPTSLVDALRAR